MNNMKKQVKIIEALPNINIDGKTIDAIKKVAAYCRVSSDHIEQKSSYVAQIDEFEKRIKSNPDWEFAGIYADEAKTGTTANRPEFNRMLQDCEEGKIDLILTKSISRFARNVELSVKTVRELKDVGVEVYFEKENIYSFDGKSEMIFTILASVAQEESRNISENSTWGIEKKMRDGKVIINHNRFLGYDKNEHGELVINENEAKIVRYIFNRYLQGAGYSTIAKELESKGTITGSGKTKWHASTVSGILQNEKYYGNVLQQKTFTVDFLEHKRIDNKGQKKQYLIENNHPAIISEDVWLAVKAKRESKFKQYAGTNTNTEKYASKYGFSGKLICEKCGATLKRRTWNAGTISERIVWQCNDYINKGKRGCNTQAVGDITLKRAFVQLYNEIVSDKDDFFEAFITTVEKVIQKGQSKSKFNQAQKNIRDVENKISMLVEMKLNGELSLDDYKREYDKINAYRDKLVGIKDKIISDEISIDEQKRRITKVREIIYNNSNPLNDFDDELFKSLIQKVIIINPVTFKFVLINGIEIPIDASKYQDGRKLSKYNENTRR